MTDTEINAMAQGIVLYLMDQCKDPIDTLSVILCIILLFYEKAKAPEADFTIEEFAKTLSRDMIKHWNTRTVATKGTETVQ